MPKIGIVLAGGANKGGYEAGALRAIIDYFGIDSIKCMSTASVGALIGQMYGIGQGEEFIKSWKSIDTGKVGGLTVTYPDKKEIREMINTLLTKGEDIKYEHYVSIWNFTKRKVEYVPLHTLKRERVEEYLYGAMSIPYFTKGVTIDGNKILDGAFLDNIPVYPLVDKDLDYIFCVYFDNFRYVFENEEFDKKVIKIYDFPNKEMFDVVFNPQAFDNMLSFGYDYTMSKIKSLFEEESPEKVYSKIKESEMAQKATYKPRLTADTVMSCINSVTKKYAGCLTNKVRE